MNLELKDKEIIVTGEAKGIGKGIVKVLVNEGAIPVIVGKLSEYLFNESQGYKIDFGQRLVRRYPVLKALKELDKVLKTEFLLNYMNDVELRQVIQRQLNTGKNANKFARAVS